MAKKPKSDADAASEGKVELHPPYEYPPSSISMSAPWDRHCTQVMSNVGIVGTTQQGGRSADPSVLETFVRERSAAHTEYIRQTEKTKRMGYGLAAVLLVIAIVVPVFAPAGRETVSWVTSATLALFAAGAFGFSKLKLQAFKQSFDAEKKG